MLAAAAGIGCDRNAHTESRSGQMKPVTEETIRSTNGLDRNARQDLHQPRPPSELPGASGSSRDIEIQDPDKAVGTNAPAQPSR